LGFWRWIHWAEPFSFPLLSLPPAKKEKEKEALSSLCVCRSCMGKMAYGWVSMRCARRNFCRGSGLRTSPPRYLFCLFFEMSNIYNEEIKW